MNLNILLLVHALVTLAGGLVLIAVPAAIPSTVGISLVREQYLLCYLLVASELAISYLSFAGIGLKAPVTLRILVRTILIFHGATFGLEILAYAQGGVGALIIGNMLLRLVMLALFGYYGYYRLRFHTDDKQTS